VKVSRRLYEFFQVEIRNEDFVGCHPATLSSALDSAEQAPEEILDEFCGEDSSDVVDELDLLITKYGEDAELVDFGLAAPLEELAAEAE